MSFVSSIFFCRLLKRVVIAPQVLASAAGKAANAPTSAKASLQSVKGLVEVDWALSAVTDSLSLVATVPVGATGQVAVPLLGKDASGVTVKESGRDVWAGGKFVAGVPGVLGASMRDGGVGAMVPAVVFEVVSGKFSFEL